MIIGNWEKFFDSNDIIPIPFYENQRTSCDEKDTAKWTDADIDSPVDWIACMFH